MDMISKKVIIKVAAIISKSCMQYRNMSISYGKVRRNTSVIESFFYHVYLYLE